MFGSHLNQDTLQRFLRAELSRQENQIIVRHLLTRCESCLDTVRAAGRRKPAEAGSLATLQFAGPLG
jgi:hypothetical protein